MPRNEPKRARANGRGQARENHRADDNESVRIPVSSPYIEVRMDTSGPYALVKARKDTSGIYTPTRHTGHTHTLHVTYTIDKHSLRARFPRAIHTTRTRFTNTLYARTIYAPHLRVQSTRPNYVYNLRAQLTRTIYVLVWRARIIRLSFARTCYAYNLHARPTIRRIT